MQCTVKYREEETKLCQEVENHMAEADIITRSNKEMQVEEVEERLKEVEATWR